MLEQAFSILFPVPFSSAFISTSGAVAILKAARASLASSKSLFWRAQAAAKKLENDVEVQRKLKSEKFNIE